MFAEELSFIALKSIKSIFDTDFMFEERSYVCRWQTHAALGSALCIDLWDN